MEAAQPMVNMLQCTPNTRFHCTGMLQHIDACYMTKSDMSHSYNVGCCQDV